MRQGKVKYPCLCVRRNNHSPFLPRHSSSPAPLRERVSRLVVASVCVCSYASHPLTDLPRCHWRLATGTHPHLAPRANPLFSLPGQAPRSTLFWDMGPAAKWAAMGNNYGGLLFVRTAGQQVRPASSLCIRNSSVPPPALMNVCGSCATQEIVFHIIVNLSLCTLFLSGFGLFFSPLV